MIPEAPDYISVRIADNKHQLHTVWLRNINSREYREGLRYVQQIILQHNISLWLTDSRKVSHVTIEDQQWIKKELVPLLVGSALSKIARVVQGDVFTYISFEQVVRTAHCEYDITTQIEQFTSEEAALGWLYLHE